MRANCYRFLALLALLLAGRARPAQGQNTPGHASFLNVPAVYRLPLSRDGLTESAFLLKVNIDMDREESSASIVLNIHATQSTAQNPNPSYLHSYNYHQRQYGDQHVGRAVFGPVRADDLKYRVRVSCGDKSWTQEVDGLDNLFGPVPRNTQASQVVVYVEVVNVNFFRGTEQLEAAIEALHQQQADAAAAAEQARRQQQQAQAKAAEQARLQKEADAKAATQARLAREAQAKAASSTSRASATSTNSSRASAASSATSASSRASSSASRAGSTGSGSSATAQAAAPEDDERAARRQQEEQAAARAEAERQRQAAEAEAAQKRQADYEAWKSQKKAEQSQAEAAAVASSAELVFALAGLLYGDMGKVNPDFVYHPTPNHAPRLFVNTQFGLSATLMPLLFQSHLSTMKNGKAVATDAVKDVQPLWLNLEGIAQVGAESDWYGGYGYWHPKAGISPIFTGHNLAVLSGGGRVYAGLPWVKLYFDLSRNYFSASRTDNDAEESGSSTLDFVNRQRTEVGLRFTFHHADYVRSHLMLGLVWERVSSESSKFRYLTPDGRTLATGTTPRIAGFTLCWKKDHSHNFYVNVFPKYLFTGEIDKPASFDASRYSGSSLLPPTNGLFEVGFIRSVDWFN